VFFPTFCGPEGRKAGSPKRRAPSHLGRGELKNCMLLWREAHLEAKTCKTHHVRTLPDVEMWKKAHSVVARSTFRSQNVKKHTMFGPLLHVQPSLCVTHAMDSAPCQKRFKRVGSVAFSKTMASVGHFKTICTDACRVAGAVRKTSSSKILGG